MPIADHVFHHCFGLLQPFSGCRTRCREGRSLAMRQVGRFPTGVLYGAQLPDIMVRQRWTPIRAFLFGLFPAPTGPRPIIAPGFYTQFLQYDENPLAFKRGCFRAPSVRRILHIQILVDIPVSASTNTRMDIEFDPAKDAINFAQHGLSFEDFSGFDEAPTVITDDRYDYGEVRYQAFGPIDGKLYCLVFTMRGSAIRAISFRRANGREKARYGKGTTP